MAMKFPQHECELTLTHNTHKSYYEDIADYVESEHVRDTFKDAEARNRSVATNEIWELQWYPHTPIGFNKVSAPTLDEVLALALALEAEEK